MAFSKKLCTCLNLLVFRIKHIQITCISYTRVFMVSNKPPALGLNALHLIYLLWILLPLPLNLCYSFDQSNLLTYLLLYVDDIIVIGPDSSYISLLKNQLALEFQISDLGPLKYFLGLQIHSSTDGIFVNQVKYLSDLLHTSGMISAKSCVTHMSTSLDLYTTAPPFNDSSLYHKLVGFLQYLTFTRPYIAFFVNRVSQFMHKPIVIHFSAVKRILKYLRGTSPLGIKFQKGLFFLRTFFYSDWAGDTSD